MKSTIVLFVLFASTFASGCGKKLEPPGGQPSSTAVVLPASANLDPARIQLMPQSQSNWCWAASAQMVLQYFGEQVEQCKLANEERISLTADCCPLNPSCDKSRWPDLLFKNRTIPYQRTAWKAALPLQTLQFQIAIKKSPVIFTWIWIKGDAHMMVATGYRPVGGDTWIDVLNPLPENVGNHEIISYDEYVSGDDHFHSVDYYDFGQRP
jgi:hypothetical protein